LRSAKVLWCTLLFLILLAGSVFAVSSREEPLTATAHQPLFDSTGESYDTRTLTTVADPQAGNGLGLIVSTPNGLKTASDIALEPTSSSTVDHLPAEEGGADAQGVIIEFNDEPVLELRAQNQSDHVLNDRRSQIAQLHRNFKSEAARVFGRPLVAHSSRAQAGKIRSIEFTDAINAVALLDVGVAEARRKFEGHPDIKRITPNSKVQTQLLDSVPQIKANQVWSYTGANSAALDGTGTRIGIIDTGVDYRHADLGGCLGQNCKVVGGYDFVNNDADPNDDHGHGTHVAATAAGDGAALAIQGVAPGAKIYAYKVLASNGSGYNTAIIAAIERCADPNQDGNYSDHLEVCSLSLGGPGNPDDPMSMAIDRASANGVVFTVAAGNSGPSEGTVSSPGTARNAITVAASCKTSDIGRDPTCTGPIAHFSSRGPVLWTNAQGSQQTLAKPDISAPGHKICAAQWGTAWSDKQCLDSDHVAISGTSMATPHVAGVVALLRQAHPEFSPDQIKIILTSSATNLGVSVNGQGAGEVSAMNAMSLSGIPSSVAQIIGVPLSIADVPTKLKATYTRTLTVKNTTSQSLIYTPSFSSTQAGFTASFSQTQLSIPGGGTGSLSVTFQIDHAVVPGPGQISGTIAFETAAGTAKVGVSAYVQDRLIADANPIDLGVDMPSLSNWNTSQTLTLTNVMTDAPANYTVSFTCCGTGGQTTNSAISASTNSTSVSLAPGASTTLSLNVAANNSMLANTRFSGTLNITSATQNLSIPVSFFKGYGIKFDYGAGTVPLYVQYHQGNGMGGLLRPSATESSTLLYVTSTGPWFAHGIWFMEAPPVNGAHVVKADIMLTQPITTVSLARNEASNTLSFNPVLPSGSTNVPNTNFKWGLIHRGSGNKFDLNGGMFTGGQIKISNLPSSYTFLAMGGGAESNGLLYSYVYRLANGISSNVTLTNTTAELVKKNLVGFQNQDGTQATAITPSFCLPSYFSTGNVYLPASCSTSSWVRTNVPANTVGSIYTYNYGAEDLSLSQYPDYPFFGLYSSVVTDTYAFPYRMQSPLFYVTPTKTFAFANAASGVKPFFTKPNTVFKDYLVPNAPGDTLSVGNGPVVDTSRWYNYANTDVSLSSRFGLNLPLHVWGGYSDEWITMWNSAFQSQLATNYVISRDGSDVASGTVSIANGAKLAIAPPLRNGVVDPGNYKLELTRQALINGTTTRETTVSTFRIVSLSDHQSSPVDENPPAISGVQITSNGLWQNVVNTAGTNTLTFNVDPVAGFLSPAAAPAPQGTYNLMADSLTSVSAEISADGGNTWNTLALSLGEDSQYRATISVIANASLYTFRIKATDVGSNTLSYTFQIPAGTVLQSPDTSVPVTTIISPTNGQTVSGTQSVNATATDNNTVSRVELSLDGVVIGSKTTSPYTFFWNTTLATNGSHSLQTKAYDAAGNIGSSTVVTVNVANATPDTVAPNVSITTPVNGGTVAKRATVTVAATATDNVGVTRVNFFVNGVTLCSDTSAPYSCSWKVPNQGGKTYKVMAYAYDQANNVGSSEVTVTSK